MNTTSIALFAAVLFAIFQYISTKMVNKEEIVPRLIIKDTIIVFVSVLGGSFLHDQFESVAGSVDALGITAPILSAAPQVFTDSPGF